MSFLPPEPCGPKHFRHHPYSVLLTGKGVSSFTPISQKRQKQVRAGRDPPTGPEEETGPSLSLDGNWCPGSVWTVAGRGYGSHWVFPTQEVCGLASAGKLTGQQGVLVKAGQMHFRVCLFVLHLLICSRGKIVLPCGSPAWRPCLCPAPTKCNSVILPKAWAPP